MHSTEKGCWPGIPERGRDRRSLRLGDRAHLFGRIVGLRGSNEQAQIRQLVLEPAQRCFGAIEPGGDLVELRGHSTP